MVFVGVDSSEIAQVLTFEDISLLHVFVLLNFLLVLVKTVFFRHAFGELLGSLVFNPEKGNVWLERGAQLEFEIIGNLLSLSFHRKIQKCESIPNKVKLYFLVKRAIRAKARQVIHFDQPGLQLCVDHYVQT